MRRIIRSLFTGAASMAALGTAVGQSANFPILVSADQGIAAYVDGERCTESVQLTFRGRSVDEFDRSTAKAARFIGNVTDLLRSQCPVLERVAVRGLAMDDIVYSGIAESATDWTVIELGARAASGVFAQGGTSGSSSAEFAAADDFIAGPSMLAALRDRPFECVGYEESSRTCLARNAYEVRGDQALVTSEYLLNDGSVVSASYESTISDDGFFCTATNSVDIVISEGGMSDDSRASMRELIRERLQAAGDEFCVGYAGSADGELRTQSFGADGSAQSSEAQAARLGSESLELRIES